jgi:tetratricopeptide (TPR) repeat protein
MTDSGDSIFNAADVQKRLEAINQQIAEESESAVLSPLLFERAQLRHFLGDDSNALADCFSASHFTWGDRLALSRIHTLISQIYLEYEQKEKALWWAMSAVDRGPESVEAQFILGQVLAFSEFRRPAVDCFRKVLALEPRHQAAQLALGVSLRETSHHYFEDAIAVLTTYVADWPDDADGWFELAYATYIAEILPGRTQGASQELFQQVRTCAGYEKHEFRIYRCLNEVDDCEEMKAAVGILPEKAELETLAPNAVTAYALRCVWRVGPFLACVGNEATEEYKKEIAEESFPSHFLSGNLVACVVTAAFRYTVQMIKEVRKNEFDEAIDLAVLAAEAAVYATYLYQRAMPDQNVSKTAASELAQATRDDFQRLQGIDVDQLDDYRENGPLGDLWQDQPPDWYRSARNDYEQKRAEWKLEIIV